MADQRGAAPTQKRVPFDFSGGRLCLDFANTLEDRPTENRTERLVEYADLVAWAEKADVLTADEATSLRGEGADRPAEAERTLSRARELRKALFDIFAALASDARLPEAALDRLNDALPDALSALRVGAAAGGFEWRWAADARGLDRMLLPVIRDAAELLTSAELSRVRICESQTCDWLFFDQSRNRTRRWCDMSTCGNRAKARRHYERQKRR